MKKILFGLSAFTMLFVTSCQNNLDFVTTTGETSNVTFSVETPEIVSRSYSDGTTATQLQYAVYDAEGNELTELTVKNGEINGSTTVNLQLTTGNTYSVIFWAAAENAPYSVDFSTKTMTVDYTNALSNDESRDAFYKYHTFTVQGAQTETIELKRPFAQLNIGTSDFSASESAGYKPEYSYVKVPVSSELNLVNGEVNEANEVEFKLAAVPSNETFPVDGFEYLSMNYLLVPIDKEVVDLTLGYSENGTTVEKTRTVGSVPVQRNYRTNIYGKLLTSNVDVNVEIEPDFEEPNYNHKVVSVSTVEEFVEALEDPTIGEVILTQDVNLNGTLSFGAPTSSSRSTSTNLVGRDIVIDGNGKTLTYNGAAGGRIVDFTKETDGANLTLKNITLLNNVSWIERGVNYNTYGTLTLENVTIKNAENCSMNYAVNLPSNSDNAKVEIKKCNIGATANALNLWGEKTIVNVINSDLYVIDNSEKESYSVISLNNDGTNTADYSVVTVIGGSVKVTGTATNGSNAVRNSTIYGKVEISETTEVVGEIKEFFAIVYYDGYNEHYSFTTLQDALNKATNDATSAGVRMIRSINDCAVNTVAPYGNYYGVKHDGVVLDGNGYTLDFEIGESKNGKADNYGIMTSGGTIKNVTITGVFRGIMIMNPTKDLYIDNVTIGDKDVCYAINTGEGNGNHSLYVSNSTIKGWNSYGTAIKDVTFNNCTFTQGTYYTNVFGRLVKPYVNAVFDSCEFNSKYYIDLSQLGKDGDGKVLDENAKIILKNCTVNGVKLTKNNWKELIVSEDNCKDGQISVELKDGSYLSANNIVDYIVFE